MNFENIEESEDFANNNLNEKEFLKEKIFQNIIQN